MELKSAKSVKRNLHSKTSEF